MPADPLTIDRFDDLIRRGEELSAWLRDLGRPRADDRKPDQGYWRVAYAFYDPAVVVWGREAFKLVEETLGPSRAEGDYYSGLGLHGCTEAALSEAVEILREAKADYERAATADPESPTP